MSQLRNSSDQRIILVDPFRDTREMYAECLAAVGFDVAAFPDSATAFAAAIHSVPAAVIAHMRQPPGCESGISLSARLRRHPKTSRIGIIVLRTDPSDSTYQAAWRAECDACLLLPTLPTELLGVVRRVVRDADLRRPQSPMSIELPRLAALERRSGGDRRMISRGRDRRGSTPAPDVAAIQA